MKKRGKIFIMRHGPTKNDILQTNKLSSYIDNIAEFINDNDGIDCVLTSPIDRCNQTATILIDKLNMNIKEKKIKHELLRKQPDETENEKNERGYTYGEYLRKKYKKINKNVLIITHSSILFSIIEGIIGNSNFHREKLHHCSLSITNNRDLILFNKGWN